MTEELTYADGKPYDPKRCQYEITSRGVPCQCLKARGHGYKSRFCIVHAKAIDDTLLYRLEVAGESLHQAADCLKKTKIAPGSAKELRAVARTLETLANQILMGRETDAS